MQAKSGKMASSGLQHHRNVLEKKHRSVGDIYAGGSGEKESRDIEALWVMERMKSRRERKEKVLRDGSRQEVQLEESLSDRCIQHRNHVIRQQLELDEVCTLFTMGQRLGIDCQQNEEEVFSRLTMLEKRDTVNSKGT
ncbi:hypothetical protein SLE2022_384810 [Rubroshorea leprosula]